VKLCFLSYYEAQRDAGRLSDSPELARFDETDRAGLERIAAIFLAASD